MRNAGAGSTTGTHYGQMSAPTPLRMLGRGRKGLKRGVVEEISWQKNEPGWMRQLRLRALETF